MGENTPSLFEVDENGQITYEQSETEMTSSDVQASDLGENSEAESEDLTNGNDVDTNADSGDISSAEMESAENSEETQEILVYSVDGNAVPVVLSDEVTTALLDATTPAGGALASSTLDYFDRIVCSLPTDFKYVAYRTDSDSSYDGVLYYGDDFDIFGSMITFGEDARQVHVERVTQSGYSTTTEYTEYDATDVVINLSKSGDIVYYSNLEVGYPVLGGYMQPTGFAPLLVAGLVSAMAVVVLTKLLLKR